MCVKEREIERLREGGGGRLVTLSFHQKEGRRIIIARMFHTRLSIFSQHKTVEEEQRV